MSATTRGALGILAALGLVGCASADSGSSGGDELAGLLLCTSSIEGEPAYVFDTKDPGTEISFGPDGWEVTGRDTRTGTVVELGEATPGYDCATFNVLGPFG